MYAGITFKEGADWEASAPLNHGSTATNVGSNQ